MSDLGMLFRAAPRGIENFVSAAVAIAVNKDARPIVAALARLKWPTEAGDHPFEGGQFRPHMSACAGYQAKVQEPLGKTTDAAQGYLDLVLVPHPPEPACGQLWVEVKVDAPETARQLDEYAKHAASKAPVPAVITLARDLVRPGVVAGLSWNDLCDAIASIADPDPAWLALREFLVAEWIARPALPTTPETRTDDFAKVLVRVNEIIRDLWPSAGPELVWLPGALKNALNRGLSSDHRMLATAGPLRYGLIPRDGRWHWWLAVAPKNSAGVKLMPAELLQLAEAQGLIPKWGPVTGRPEVLERTASVEELRQPYEVEAWFSQALGEIKASGMVDIYLSRIARSHAPPTAPDTAPEGTTP